MAVVVNALIRLDRCGELPSSLCLFGVDDIPAVHWPYGGGKWLDRISETT